MIFWRVKRRIIAEVAEIIAPIRHKFYRMKVINKNVSIISQNCLGGVISHDLGLRFLSPTVNLYMTSSDFMLFVENLREFKDADMRFIQSDRNYPVAECFLGEKKLQYILYTIIPVKRLRKNGEKDTLVLITRMFALL